MDRMSRHGICEPQQGQATANDPQSTSTLGNILLSIRARGSFPYFPIAISPRQLIHAPLSLYKSGRACTGGRARDCIATRSDQTTRSSKNAKAKYANTAEAPPFHASFPSDRTQCDGPQETPYWVQTIRFRARTVQQTQGRAPCSPPRLQI